VNFFETVESVFHDWRYDHPRILYSLIRAMKPSVAVEVGTYRGYAACYMARALQENNNGHLYCIDNLSLTDHLARYGTDPVTHWGNNLTATGVRDWATLIVGKSDEVIWPAKIDFAYIDGWHSYQTCLHDFTRAAYAGASCICLDDIVQSVGPRMVFDLIRKTDEWQVLELFHDCGMGICVRKTPKPPYTFSQELPDNPGVDLRPLSRQERIEHFAEASKTTGLDYSEFCQ